MSINKNFVIKNGLEVNTSLLVANTSNGRIGVGTTAPTQNFHVVGGIGATHLNITGVATMQNLNVPGITTFTSVTVGNGVPTGTGELFRVFGAAYIQSNTGIGVTLPTARLHVVPPSNQSAGIFSGTTSEDMVRITQYGTGNALVVEDESNIDATPFVITGLGTVGIGLTNPNVLLTAYSSASTGTTAIYARGDVVGTGVGSFVSHRSQTAVVSIGTVTRLTGQSFNYSGVSTVGFLTASQLYVAGITTLGQTNTTGFSNAGVSTLGNATATNAVVSGFSTLGSVSAANLTLAGVTTGLNVPGISTLGFIQNTTLNVTGFSTLGESSATLLNVYYTLEYRLYIFYSVFIQCYP